MPEDYVLTQGCAPEYIPPDGTRGRVRMKTIFLEGIKKLPYLLVFLVWDFGKKLFEDRVIGWANRYINQHASGAMPFLVKCTAKTFSSPFWFTCAFIVVVLLYAVIKDVIKEHSKTATLESMRPEPTRKAVLRSLAIAMVMAVFLLAAIGTYSIFRSRTSVSMMTTAPQPVPTHHNGDAPVTTSTTEQPNRSANNRAPDSRRSTHPPAQQPSAEISAPNGIAIGGGTVTNPTVNNNNYAPPQRHLSLEFIASLSKCLSQDIGDIDISAIQGNVEAWQYAQDWYTVFRDAGWRLKDHMIHTFLVGGGTLPVGTSMAIRGTWNEQEKHATYDHESPEGHFLACLAGRALPESDKGTITPYPDIPVNTVRVQIYPEPNK